ncbi:hypothetical protein AMAG_06808 [Allomyces macrogynus ATCC 38327]|uniref:PH domain-containing protein n=1 Tax=Allomyces macrogynus (strain ATCC 38327) TaxID=578462 RepID=A0A0L0SEU2_ALLM3|nr:hypothetical protein AMAG_06808 [Allomyces macrogynus ATCC 38327]|eukprot:KNE61053.1 hypothetical protein AMAG_06808 [Allomyces macrogynus ATCC 38327]
MDHAVPAAAAATGPGAAAPPPPPTTTPTTSTGTPPRVYIPGHAPHRHAYLPTWLVAPAHDINSGHASAPASPTRAVDRAASLPSLATMPTAVAPAAEPGYARHHHNGPNARRSAASSTPRPRVGPRQTLLRSLSTPSHLASFVSLNVDRLPPPPPPPPVPAAEPPPHLLTDTPVRASPTVSLRSRGGSNASALRPGTPTSSARVAPSPVPARAPVKGILRRRVGRMLVETPTSDAGTDRTPRAAVEGNRWPSLTLSEATFRTAPTHPLLERAGDEYLTAPMAPLEDQEVPVVPAVHFDAAPPSVRLTATGTPSTGGLAPTPTPPAPPPGATLHPPPSPLGASLRPPSPLGASLRPPSPLTPGLGSRRASFDPDAVANEATIFELLPAAEPPPRVPTESAWTRCWHAVTACCRPSRTRKEGKVEVLFSCVVLARVDRVSVMAEGGRKKADADAFWSEYNAFVVRVMGDGDEEEGGGGGGEWASYAVHLCRVQSTSPNRPLKAISLDHARLSLANPSDGSLSLWPRGQPDRYLLHAPSAALATALYMVLWQAVPRALRWPAPIAVDVHVPDLDLAIRFSCHPYTPTLAECHAAALDALRDESDADPHVRAWLARAPHQLAWRRGDRIEWIDAAAPGLESVVAPYSIEKTHALELRAVGPHRATPEGGDATQCEGYPDAALVELGRGRGRGACTRWSSCTSTCFSWRRRPLGDRLTPTTAAGWTESMARRPFAVVDSRARAKGCVVPGAEFLRLEDITALVVPRPCAECRAKLAALTHVTDGAGVKLVQLAAEDTYSAAPPHFQILTRHAVLDMSAETHAALHAWVELVAHAVVADRWTRARRATAYARTLEHNAEVYATELHAREDLLAAMTASPALWPRGLTDPGNVVKCAHRAYVKSRFRGWFRPVLVLVTDDHVVVCERGKRTGMWTPKRWIAVHARTHVLVGAVDPKTGVGVRDEAAGGVGGVPTKWFGGGPAAPVAAATEEEDVSATAVAPTVPTESLSRAGTPASLLPPSRTPDPFLRGAPASMMPVPATPSPTTVSFPTTTASLPRPPTTPPPPTPVVVTRHESAHQTCFTLWSPPARGDVVKAAARRGKVHVVQCRQKWERDQLVVAIEAVVARKVVDAVGEDRLRAIVAGATAGVRGTGATGHEHEHDQVADSEQQDGRREEARSGGSAGGAAGTAAAMAAGGER